MIAGNAPHDIVPRMRWWGFGLARVALGMVTATLAVVGCAVLRQTPEQREYAAYDDACRLGDGASCYSAGMIAVAWEGRAPDAAEIAEGNFIRGCDAEDASSCRRLALYWTPIEPRTAVLYHRRACNAGNQKSCEDLGSAEAKRDRPASSPAAAPTVPPPPRQPAIMSGSCFFVAPGVAVTNHHVIDAATEVMLIDARGRTHIAQVLRDDAQVDLAVLEVVTAADMPPMPLAADKDVPLGEQVFTIGFPVPGVLGTDPKFSEGSLGGQTGLGAAWLYQITVPVQPGNSGGPLVDHRGFVVGVIVAKLRADRLMQTEGVTPENVNFAIKSAELRRVIRGLKLSIAKAAKNRQAAIERTQASVCQVVAKSPEARPSVDPSILEQHRSAGDRQVRPDTATVAEMRRQATTEFRAVVEVCVTGGGEVDRVAVTTSSGFPAYDERLQREIKAWRFRPIAIDGHQVSVCSALEFKGRLRAAGE